MRGALSEKNRNSENEAASLRVKVLLSMLNNNNSNVRDEMR